MAAHPKATADRLRLRREAEERRLTETNAFIDQHEHTTRRQSWENRTQKAIEQREVDEITRKLLREDEQDLERRRQELQSLYSEELEGWKKKLRDTLEVTPQERMEQIRTRAYALKEKREAEREQFVKECYERQWRDACDDLRAFESKATLERIVKDRAALSESKRLHEQERERSGDDDVDGMCLISKDESDEQRAQAIKNARFRQTLDHQVEMKRAQAEANRARTRLEEEENQRRLAQQEEEAQEAARRLEEKARKEGEEIYRETRERAADNEEKRRLEREANLVVLERAIDKERREIEAEEAKKEDGKEAAAEYVACLREQALAEEKETDELNKIRDAELGRMERLRDEKLRQEDEKRRRWMEEVSVVDVSRQQQIKRRQEGIEALRRSEEQEAAAIKAALLRAEEADRVEAERAAALRMEVTVENKATIEARAKAKEMGPHEKRQAQNRIQQDEREYQKRLEEQKSSIGVRSLI
ncbi:hypothetical protein ACHAXT_010384 [Thalassiosira profunda]